MSGTLVQATRGPIVLMALGGLMALDHNGVISFGRTWPALLIVFGIFKFLEHVGRKAE